MSVLLEPCARLTPATLLSTPSTLFLTPLTLSSTVCVIFRTRTVAIRPYSCVSLSRSSLFSVSSISLLPIKLFTYFSEHRSRHSVNIVIFIQRILTHLGFLNHLHHNSKSGEDLNHYPNNYIHHVHGWRHFCITLETAEKQLNALKRC
jgi:hypothetical protein